MTTGFEEIGQNFRFFFISVANSVLGGQ